MTTNLIALAAIALIAYPLLLLVLMAASGGHRARRWFGGLRRGSQSLVALGLAVVLAAGVWAGPNVVAPMFADDPIDCHPTGPVRARQAATGPTPADLSAPTRPPERPAPGVVSGAAAPTAEPDRRPALVLYDGDGGRDADWTAQLTAQQAANVASHFGPWIVKPVEDYKAGEAREHSAVLYFGTSPEFPIPAAFLDDVMSSRVPVFWAGENLDQLADHAPWLWKSRYGFRATGPGIRGVDQVDYRGTALTRETPPGDRGIRTVRVDDPGKAKVLAEAHRPDGSRTPWAVRAANLWYIVESPFNYTTATNRYLAFSDLLFDVLAPATQERHRALVRLEDIGPNADPDQLRDIGTCLHQAGVPFSFGVLPIYIDPYGKANQGEPTSFTLKDRPEVVEALRYLIDHGGTVIMHGVTHQLGTLKNPYHGISGEDFEFFLAHQDSKKFVIPDGMVPGMSRERTLKRLDQGLAEFRAAGLPRPQIFEFPHYAAGPVDYEAVGQRFGYRYDQTMNYASSVRGGFPDARERADQFYPYGVRDVYGSAVIPENLGNVESTGHNGLPPIHPEDIIDAAKRNLVVRDGVASFFYHPPLGVDGLREIVQGILDLGYDFVRPSDIMK
ncbi:polysaccharide deacetylase family protein [Streptomyces sp. CB03238]|uniref:DUF2334 domain-containing protein n=1 Tax=Streptomyces sp. CB03238 TaxID=1907777 RepID=UPI000A110C39|nr:polysaccharide deacetylase family protein [Streptomyces sp. CB03238]ORT57308.1 hypothetical protein BKD26_23880 [Streptomyces sp. CB03238]